MRLMKHHTVLTLTELRSGQVGLTQQRFREDYCTEHRGQVFWFFCNTCDVPICRDCTIVEHPTGSHDVVKLDSVVLSQKEEIEKLVVKCTQVKEQVDDSLEKTHSIHRDLEFACDKATKQVMETTEKVKKTFHTILKKQEEDLKESITEIKQTREKALSGHEEELHSLQYRLNTALEMANQVSTEGSNCDIASAYKPLATTLKQLGQVRSPSIDLGMILFVEESSLTSTIDLIGKIEADRIRQVTQGKSVRITNKDQWNAPWMMVKKFGDTGKEKLKNARGVVINEDGDVAVADYSASRVYVYSIEDGKMKLAIDTTQSLHSNPRYQSFPNGVAVSLHSLTYIVADDTNFLTIYDCQGKYLRQISNVGDSSKLSVDSVTINKQGNVLFERNSVLRVHVYADGTFKSSMQLPFKPYYIAVSSDDKTVIIIANSSEGAQVIDSQGQTIHVLRPPTDVTSPWYPSGVCTIGEGEEEEIFVCNYGGTRRVYRFSLTTGKYLGCVTTDVSEPHGIAFTEDENLVVADKTCVKVFAPAD